MTCASFDREPPSRLRSNAVRREVSESPMMLTVRQVAGRLNISVGLVYALCNQGKLSFERYGLGRGTIRVSEESLARYRAGAGGAATSAAVPPMPRLRHVTLKPGSPAGA